MKKVFNRLEKNALLEDMKISPKNKRYINKFLEHMKNYVVPERLKKYRYSLTRFAYFIEKDFDKITREDMRKAGGIINTGDLATKTKIDIIANIRTAFKFWFGNGEDFPEVVKGLKRLNQRSRLNLPDKMPSEKEIYSMIKACPNNRDKFFIALIGLDGALRPIELRRLKWKQIQKDKHSHFITVETAKKSGDKETRVIRIIKSAPYFEKWTNEYPKEKTKEDFVFINYQNLKPVDAGTIYALFRRLNKKLNFNYKIYPYLLRHALLTKMSKDPRIAVSVLKKFAGHSLSSNTISEYQHFGDDDIKDMQLQYNGLKEKKGIKEKVRRPRDCPKCKTSNEYDAEFCQKCSMALSQERMVQVFDEHALQNPQFKEMLKDVIKEIEKEKGSKKR